MRCSVGKENIIVAGDSYHRFFSYSYSYSYSVKRYSYSKRSIGISFTDRPNTGGPVSLKR